MGKKEKTIFVCSECGEDFLQWQGQCPACKQWNCLKRFRVENDVSGAAGKKAGGGAGARAVAGIGSDTELRKSGGWMSDCSWAGEISVRAYVRRLLVFSTKLASVLGAHW